MMQNTVYWITGLSSAGKTVVGQALCNKIKQTDCNVIFLDGDVLKNALDAGDAKYTADAREKRAFQYAKICKLLSDQGFVVICSCIAMYESVRRWNRENLENYVEVFLDVPVEVLIARDKKNIYQSFYSGKTSNIAGLDVKAEFPENPDLRIINDGSQSISEVVSQILLYSMNHAQPGFLDGAYWNDYYAKQLAPLEPSRFAMHVSSFLKKGETLLDLGCGNGRDSLFFIKNGLDVTALDRSQSAISQLAEGAPSTLSCVCAEMTNFFSTLGEYAFDHCYSRFSIHSLTGAQQVKMIKNAYAVLRKGGMFWIETRSVNDSMYGKGICTDRHTYFYQGHSRRFVVLEELVQDLQAASFSIVSAEESTGFAPHFDEDPMVIRVCARK